jgi:hypothetical protein
MTISSRWQTRSWGSIVVLALAVAIFWSAPRLRAHTITEPSPFHLSPGDLFTVPVGGATFSDPATLQIRFTPFGGGASVNGPAESVIANTSVSARVPAGLAVGQYTISVLLSGTPSDPPEPSVWVRNRPFHFIARSTIHLPGQPTADFKDADFADVDNDGFLDVFEANSAPGFAAGNIDRLEINQLGKPMARDCTGTSDFCDQTAALSFPNTVAGLAANRRTYDADLVDLDLDGDLDLVRIDAAADAQLRVMFNNGSGQFTDRTVGAGAVLPAPTTLGALANFTAMVDTGDADGDGRPDILTCNWGGAQNLLLINRLSSGGGFVLANDNPCDPTNASAHALCRIRPEINRGCAFGDFNNDGKQDILAPTMDGNRPVHVLLNTGNNASGIPQFDVRDNWVQSAAGGVPDPTNGGKLKVADMDGDGDDDAVLAAPRDEMKRRILWNDGGTRLVELADARYAPFGGSYEVSLADLDRDGDIDMIFTFESGTNAVLANKGGRNANMKFEEVPSAGLWLAESPGGVIPNPGGVTAFALAVSAGDYDLDGDHDLVTGGGSMKLWKSDLFDQPGEDRDWIFAQDRTRSMITGGKDFFEPSKNVMRAFLAQRRPGDQAGLVTFDYTGADQNNPNAADHANKAHINFQVGVRTPVQLQSDVAALTIGSCTGFCTAIGWALKTATEVAQASPDATREKVIVLLTDGRQNQAPHPDTIIPTIPSNIRVYTIALGTDTDDRLLSAMATNGGKFYFAGRSTDYATMQSVMRDVDEKVEGHATGKQPLQPIRMLLWSPVLREVFSASPYTRALMRSLDQPPPRGVVTHHFIVDPSDRQVRFTLSWRGFSKTNRMVLTDPKGRAHPIAGAPGTRERRDDRSHVIEVTDPLSGVWSMGEQITSDTGPGKATATASSGLRLVAGPVFPLFYLNEPLIFRAELSEPIAGVTAQATLLSPSKVAQTIVGTVKEKTIEFRSPNLTEPGTYHFELAVVGPPSRPFVRHSHEAVVVAEPTAEEPDLRNAELTLQPAKLEAGASGTATATLRLKRRDGKPLPGAQVSFVPTLGAMGGAVQDHGDGRYTQALSAGQAAGNGILRARAGVVRLPNEVPFTVSAGTADPKQSTFWLLVGALKLCTNEPGPFGARLAPVDTFGNAMPGAKVQIEQSSGPSIRWVDEVHAVNGSDIYERRFRTPGEPGAYEFRATVNGVALDKALTLDAYDAASPEGLMIGCFDRPAARGGLPPWLLWLLLLLLILLIIWWLARRRAVTA